MTHFAKNITITYPLKMAYTSVCTLRSFNVFGQMLPELNAFYFLSETTMSVCYADHHFALLPYVYKVSVSSVNTNV